METDDVRTLETCLWVSLVPPCVPEQSDRVLVLKYCLCERLADLLVKNLVGRGLVYER